MKIALIGYGKMGRAIERIALQRGHEIVARIDRDNLADIDSEAFRSADVAIEFTTPATAVIAADPTPPGIGHNADGIECFSRQSNLCTPWVRPTFEG